MKIGRWSACYTKLWRILNVGRMSRKEENSS